MDEWETNQEEELGYKRNPPETNKNNQRNALKI